MTLQRNWLCLIQITLRVVAGPCNAPDEPRFVLPTPKNFTRTSYSVADLIHRIPVNVSFYIQAQDVRCVFNITSECVIFSRVSFNHQALYVFPWRKNKPPYDCKYNQANVNLPNKFYRRVFNCQKGKIKMSANIKSVNRLLFWYYLTFIFLVN